jgi:YD repeat-containing protein
LHLAVGCAGNVTQRSYTATNQVSAVKTFTGVDPTHAKNPAGGLTTRYVYDARDRLRFVVTTQGEVTEYTTPAPATPLASA